MAARNIAHLAGGRPVALGDQRGSHTREIAQQNVDVRGNVVIARYADEVDCGTDRHQVAHHISRAAEHCGLVGHATDRDGRFGRNPANLSIDETV